MDDPSDRGEMEVLTTGDPPSALRAWIERQLVRPGVRAALVMVLAVVLIGVWTSLPKDDRNSATNTEEAPIAEAPPGLRPPPPRGRESPTGDWQVANDVAITSGPKGHVVTFSAFNAGATAQDPADLQVVGAFVDRDDLDYVARCAGVDLDARGGPRFDGLVEPGYKVFVRCRDVTRYGGRAAWIDPGSITVRKVPCESEEPTVPM